MSEEFIRHFLSFLAMLIAGIVFYGGYVAGANGWWVAAFAILAVYPIVFGLLEV